MTHRELPAVGLLAVAVAIAAASGYLVLAPSSPTAASPGAFPPVGVRPVGVPQRAHRGALGEADGLIPDDTTVFDEETPGVVNLDPALLDALRAAAAEAADDDIVFVVESGWRSPAYQEQLLADAVSTYGSKEEAARWVATPETSAHVSGDAVDVGPFAATAWLSEHGAAYGLCQTYRNEPWHYELRPDATGGRCPRPYADPTRDPRMRG